MTQKRAVKQHLTERGNITSWGAIKEYGITRLSEYIHQLRKDGMSITTERVIFTNRYKHKASYAKYIFKK